MFRAREPVLDTMPPAGSELATTRTRVTTATNAIIIAQRTPTPASLRVARASVFLRGREEHPLTRTRVPR